MCLRQGEIAKGIALGVYDPVAFGIVPCFLFAVASIAIVLPARRATEVDPAVTLRCE
jgi:ABC-type lipoprotein release transport system permease subunit